MKVLVTGGAGYLGQILCEHLLDAGYDVTVLDNLMYGQTGPLHLAHNPNFHFVYGDVRDVILLKDLVKQSDVVIPLAAIVGAPACSKDRHLVTFVNEVPIANIANYADGKLIIFPNTNSGYGAQPGIICTEDTPTKPMSVYALSKQYGEDFLLRHSNAIILRLATVFGISPRMRLDLLVNDFVYKAVTDRYLVLFEPHFKRNFVHIRDVADCFIHCIENASDMVGRAYNVGNDDANCAKWELGDKIKDHIRDICIYYSDLGSDPDKRDYVVSNERLRQAGFECKRSLDQGIEELIQGYKMLPRGVYRNA